MGSVNGFLYRKLLPFASSFWLSVSTLFLVLFAFFNRTMFRFKSNNLEPEGEAKVPEVEVSEFKEIKEIDELDEKEMPSEAKEPEVEVYEFKETKEVDELKEKETPKFFFKFQFQTYREEDEPVVLNSVTPASTNKYEFLSGKNFSHYLEEPEVGSLTVKELYADSDGDSIDYKEKMESGVSSDKDFAKKESEAESVREEIEEISAHSVREQDAKKEFEVETSIEEEAGKLEEENCIEESISRKGKAVVVENNVSSDGDVSRDDDAQFLSDMDLIVSDSDSVVSNREFMSRYVASTSDGFLSDKDFEDVFELDILKDIHGQTVESTDEDLELEFLNLQNLNSGYEADDFDDEDSDIMEELKNIEEAVQKPAMVEDTEMVSERDFEDNKSNQKERGSEDNEAKDILENPKSNSQDSSAADSEDSNDLETLWEHQDLIEQLKMELKKVRATGLPTILEEDESPKIMEDLKPWKIDEKFQHEDRMSELHKFYKSYRERMRKLDILSYQKVYAMNLLQSKDPVQSIATHEASAPALTSLLPQKFLLSMRRKSSSDPMMNFVREYHNDLEVVYVGQLCLSWEILHWQYEKALELWDSDPYGMRQYNEVAGEFQQFQVILQRFIENEPFEGPRVKSYIKNRYLLRNLLQVPVIKEDSMKDKKARRKGRDDDSITSDMLVEIMEESIRIFWRFVRSDKDAQNVISKGRKGTQIEPQDPTELELLTEVRTIFQKVSFVSISNYIIMLQVLNMQSCSVMLNLFSTGMQKERRLKDVLRSGNCILRKFQKHREDDSNQVLYFFSQVDMKLVARVLSMSRVTTDQLLWCHNKLSKINFVSRKIHVEPSFLLFPC
ncbi:uncharacterized protein [Populus alba]|uniref:uncharacterized protein isoform X1 n=2 Tax=Populus alba TaxID=43335 RepID=UPI00158E62DF|nr:uncharacterized protein LOC118029159 isoform X1 [Populus alba]